MNLDPPNTNDLINASPLAATSERSPCRSFIQQRQLPVSWSIVCATPFSEPQWTETLGPLISSVEQDRSINVDNACTIIPRFRYLVVTKAPRSFCFHPPFSSSRGERKAGVCLMVYRRTEGTPWGARFLLYHGVPTFRSFPLALLFRS